MTIVRKIEPRDVPLIYQYGVAEERFAVSKSMQGFWTEEQLYHWMGRENDVLLVAESQNEIAGFMFSSLNEANGKALLENLLVREKYRGRGIGIRLIRESLSRLKENGARFYVNLIEQDNEKTIKMFEHLDFKRGQPMIWMDKLA